MNARQKAKYWKKRYKELIGSPIKGNVLYAVPGTETLRCDRIISDEIYNMAYDNPELQRKIFGDVISGLAEQAKPFVEISVEKDIFNCGVKIRGQLAVVRPVYDYHDQSINEYMENQIWLNKLNS